MMTLICTSAAAGLTCLLIYVKDHPEQVGRFLYFITHPWSYVIMRKVRRLDHYQSRDLPPVDDRSAGTAGRP